MTADQFRAALKSLGLYQMELAELLGLTTSQVSRWAKGRTPIPRYVPLVLELLALKNRCRNRARTE